MPVGRDPRTGRWFFRCVVKTPSGPKRLFGTPGVPGPFQDLGHSKVGAMEAERRAIAAAMSGTPINPPAQPAEQKEIETLKSYSETFLASYVPTVTKPSARRSIEQILAAPVLSALGHLGLDQVRQADVDSFVAAERKRGIAVKTINNRLAVVSSLIKYAVANGVISPPKPPLKCKVRGGSPEVASVPADQVEKLLAAPDDRERVVVLLASEAGLRAGEIRGAPVHRPQGRSADGPARAGQGHRRGGGAQARQGADGAAVAAAGGGARVAAPAWVVGGGAR